MITDIPTEDDFNRSAARFLEAGWTEALARIQDASEIEELLALSGEEPDETDEATQSLAVAHIAVYTGIEHLLRARIAAISPFLLFAGPPDKWPRDCAKKDTPFADFKTVDAQDLVRVHDAVCEPKLSQQFQSFYDDLRRKRNSLIHSHTKNVRVVAKDMLVAILYATNLLVAPGAWLEWRRRALEARDIHWALFSWNLHMTRECDIALNVLGAKEVKEYLGIDKRRRRYFCPECFANRSRQEEKGGAPDVEGVAQVDPKNRTLLRCVVCSVVSTVERRRCMNGACKGDVIGNDECMTCGDRQT